MAAVKKSVRQRWRWPRGDAGDFRALPGEKICRRQARRADENFADRGNKVFLAAQFADAKDGDAVPDFLAIAFDQFQPGSFSERAAHGDNRGLGAEARSQISGRNNGGATGEICPADEHQQRPDEERTEFFEDECEDEDDGRNLKKRDKRRLKQLREQKPGGIGKNDGGKGTVHFLPAFAGLADEPEQQQSGGAASGVNEHVRDLRRARGHKDLMKFIAGRVEKNHGERESGFRPVPRSRSIFLWLPDGAPEQQREDGVFRQMGAFAEEIMNLLNASL